MGNVVNIVFDVDGVLTDGKFHYSKDGKIQKTFGPHDADALKIMGPKFELFFISADHRGFEISKRRVEDLGFKLHLISAHERARFISNLAKKNVTVFVGDSFTDVGALQNADFGVVPKNAHKYAKASADLILKQNGGEGAVAEICQILNPIVFKELNK